MKITVHIYFFMSSTSNSVAEIIRKKFNFKALTRGEQFKRAMADISVSFPGFHYSFIIWPPIMEPYAERNDRRTIQKHIL